jgi:Protein of unknown function (DUF1439)
MPPTRRFLPVRLLPVRLMPVRFLPVRFSAVRHIAVCLMAGALLAACAGNPLLPGELRYSYNELNERIARHFPLEKSIAGLLEVTLSNPRFAARDDSTPPRLGASFDLEVKVPLSGKTLFGTVALSGVPRYDAAARALYLDGARVDNLRTDNMPDGLSAALGKAAASLARETLAERPLYTFNAADLERYGGATPRRIELRRDGIALIMR